MVRNPPLGFRMRLGKQRESPAGFQRLWQGGLGRKAQRLAAGAPRQNAARAQNTALALCQQQTVLKEEPVGGPCLGTAYRGNNALMTGGISRRRGSRWASGKDATATFVPDA